ncbi:VWA domain-containing protein [Micromonospora sp. NPDC049523]|uniref:VWA domain-containing protein n=1 Tax=Micromonospora sp. NPDC049523 TaxID=3155921 RepID=UPI00341E17C4
MNSRRRSMAVLLGLLAALTLPGIPPAVADDEPISEPPKLELVLDVSGSMRAKDIGGRSRIAVAQQAFHEVVDAVPDETQLGIRVLGATYSGDDKKVGCQDTQQIVPVGPVDRTQAKAAIAGLRPTGFTPVGRALRAAAEDLGTGGTTRRIVLITDGEDTCAPPDPCEVARELAAQGTHLVVDTLGLAPDEKVRRQLVCIAAATGGTYTSAQSVEQLSGRIKQLVNRASDTYTQTPVTVAGSNRCENAPILQQQGVYTDRERPQEQRFYRVPVASYQELRASVSVALDRPLNPHYGVLLRAVAADGRELVRGTDAGSGRTDVLSTGVRWSGAEAPAESPSASPSGSPTAAPTPSAGSSASPSVVAPGNGQPIVCLVVSNSFSTPTGANDGPGMPIELTIDVVDASPALDTPGLSRGWVLLGGLAVGLILGWFIRWVIATRRETR